MLRSNFCLLHDLEPEYQYELNECPLDQVRRLSPSLRRFINADLISLSRYVQGGYFIINGSEKVLIAQERMAANHIYVFAKAQPSPVNFLAEIRSMVEKGGKTISMMQVKMYHRGQEKTVSSFLSIPFPPSLSLSFALRRSLETRREDPRNRN